MGEDQIRKAPSGLPSGVDISEALRASEQRYQTLFEQAPIGVFVYDRSLRIVECNAKFVTLLASSQARLIGLDMHTLRDQRVLPAIKRALEGDFANYAGPYEATTSNAKIWISMRTSPLRDRQGQVALAMGLIEDITEQKMQEMALRASEARFRTVVEFSPDLVGVMRNGLLLYVNLACARHWGYESAAELVGRPVTDFVPPEDIPVLKERMARQTSGAMLPAYEYRIVRKDGSIVHDEIASIMVDYDGEPALLSIGRDMTERKLMQARLLQADRMASVGTLAAGVAHEINNPLAYLMANLEIVAVRALPDLRARVRDLEAKVQALTGGSELSDDASSRITKLAQMIEVARDGAERVRHTVRDLKTFSRSDDDRRSLVDVRTVLDASINIAWNEIRHRAQLVREYADVPPVLANESRLGQVFLNLLVNAAQALPVGMATQHKIRVRAFRELDRVVVEVRDSGAGISKENLQRLFDPFFTTKPVGVGTGLGLWICEGIVAALGGTIRAESEPGRETTFRVDLPAHVAGNAPPAKEESIEPTLGARRGRILIIDDEAPLAKVLASALSTEHDTVVVTSGREAFELLNEDTRFDVILCDLMMPEMTGMDLHAELVGRAPHLASRMIFMTGGAFTPRGHEFIARADNPIVEKPVDQDRLLALVRKLLA